MPPKCEGKYKEAFMKVVEKVRTGNPGVEGPELLKKVIGVVLYEHSQALNLAFSFLQCLKKARCFIPDACQQSLEGCESLREMITV